MAHSISIRARTVRTTLVIALPRPRIIPVKFGQNPVNSLKGDV